MPNRRWYASVIMLLLFAAFANAAQVKVVRLRCEGLAEPVGVDAAKCRFSWCLESKQPGVLQKAYQILVASERELLAAGKADMWDSQVVDSDKRVGIAYGGAKLQHGSQYWWKVRIRDEAEDFSDWSTAQCWWTGLRNEQDWGVAKWIGIKPEAVNGTEPLLRKEFVLEEKPEQAVIFVAALGYFELYINGKKVGEEVLSPAVCDFSKRALYTGFDVTEYLKEGKNCVGLWLGQGWYVRPKVRGVTHAGPLGRLKMTMRQGKNVREVVSDQSWKCSASGITPLGSAGHSKFGGERIDGRVRVGNWSESGFDDSQWAQAQHFNVTVPASFQAVQGNKVAEKIEAKEVKRLADGSVLIDMGRNFTGSFEIEMDGQGLADQEVKFVYGDLLRKDGSLQHYGQWDEYVFAGRQHEKFRNRFNYHGFRYVKAEGLERVPACGDIRGYLIHSGYADASEFDCSNKLLKQIYDTVKHTYRCLSLGGYVVDCPHRERLGYGADGQASMKTGFYNFDTRAFYRKWTRDWRDGQDPDSGDVENVAPYWYTAGGGPNWSGMCVTLPWRHYLQYGDASVLAENYQAMRKWLVFIQGNCTNGLMQRYGNPVWGFLGDWVPPGRGQAPRDRVDEESTLFFNNCYYVHCLRTAAKAAAVLGKDDDNKRFMKLAQHTAELVHERFFDEETGGYANGEQTYLAVAMLFGITPADLEQKVMNRLEWLIMQRCAGHLNTGSQGTFYMFELLTSRGRDDLIYQMVNKRTYPGYGYMLEQGATTIWEQWNGKNSQIHNTMLAVGSWFIEGLGGIRIDEDNCGFEQVIIRPAFNCGLDWAKASYDSVQGPIETAWKKQHEQLELDVQVPAGCVAAVYLPGQDVKQVFESGKPVNDALAVKFAGKSDETLVFNTGSGEYHFVVKRID